MSVQQRLVFYLVPVLLLIVAGGVFYFFGGGLFGNTEDVVVGLKDSVYESVNFGTDSLSSNVTISAEHKEEIENLVNSIKSLQGKENCFLEYTSLTDLEERGVSISFEKTLNGTKMTVMGGAGGTQIITDLLQTIEGMEPCVIAGSTTAPAKNFEDYYFKNEGELSEIHYSNVNSVSILYTDGGYWRYSANVIQVPSLGINRGNNFKSNGWLYTPDGKNFCFFPVSGNYEEGLPDKYFEGGDGSIETFVDGVGSNAKSCS